MVFKKSLLFCLICLLFSQALISQIVNIEDKRTQLDTQKWQGQFNVNSKFTQNAKSVFAVSSLLRVDKTGVKDKWLFLANYNFVRAGQENFIDDGFMHIRYGKDFKPRWQWEVFGQIQYNERLQITLRGLLGTGARIQLLEKEKTSITTGLLYMYEYNELDAEIGTRRDHRISSYLTIRFKPKENFSFSSTSYYQPLLNNFGQSRLSTINTLVVKATKHLSFTSSFSLTYDAQLSKDVEGVPPTTYQWQNGVRLVF